MLVCEYNYAEDIATQRAEERRIAFSKGRSEGFSDGARQKSLETAQILKQLGDSVQKIIQATGLSQEEIEKL